MMRSIAERLAERSRPDPSGCVIFTGGLTRGYGGLSVNEDGVWRRRYAHRLAYEVAYGPIPAGLFVCHRCDVPACINPAHLFVGTHRDNMADRDRKGRCSGNYAVHAAPRGERSNGAKLTEAQVREFKSRYMGKRGELPRLARELGIGIANARRIAKGQTWREVRIEARAA
jgi:HNH endonuclease